MKIAFFISSVGDTDLAKATISKLLEQGVTDSILLIPLTTAADKRTEDLIGHQQITRFTLAKIINQPDALSTKKQSADTLQKVAEFVAEHKIQHAFIGVASAIDEETPYQIANCLNIPCTIAYEFMFKPLPHCFWEYLPSLSEKPNCDIAVPLQSAETDILVISQKASVKSVGHLCIDRAQAPVECDKAAIKQTIKVARDEDLAFISGTTQPIGMDNAFLDAILSEVSTGNYPTLQIRFGLHPGIKDPDLYLQTLLETCNKYPKSITQFKIILTDVMEKRLKNTDIKNSNFILCSNTSGPDMSLAADRVAQSVPGALLNEAALAGKPSYYHVKSTTPYLPESWFSKNISTFFTDRALSPPDPKVLGLTEPVSMRMAKLFNH